MREMKAVIIRRNYEENTVAIVRAEVDEERISSVNLLSLAISRAVTRWCQSGRGWQLQADNNGSISIGDIAAEGIDRDTANGIQIDLFLELRKEGIDWLSIECHEGEATAWDYDDNLANNPDMDEA